MGCKAKDTLKGPKYLQRAEAAAADNLQLKWSKKRATLRETEGEN